MTELKTLTDIFRDEPQDGVSYQVLKAEAIKRWKTFAIYREEAKKENDTELIAYYEGKCDEIQSFNNITEEDLE
jgi:hypothetical protein